MSTKKKTKSVTVPKPKPKSKRGSKKIEAALARLTPKQRILVEGIMRGKSKTQATIDAGYEVGGATEREKRKRANHIGIKTLETPAVKSVLSQLLEQKGLGISELLDGLKEGTQATKVVAVIQLPQPKTGEESKTGNELIPANEQTTSYIEVPDHATRFKFIDKGLAIHGIPDRDNDPEGAEPYHERINKIWNRLNEKTINVTATEVKG